VHFQKTVVGHFFDPRRWQLEFMAIELFPHPIFACFLDSKLDETLRYEILIPVGKL
jgi:hypothetical protein